MLKIHSALCHTVLENECSCISAAACRGCSHPVDAIADTQILALADSPLDLHVPLLQGDEHFILLLGNVKHVLQEEEQAADSESTDARTHARAADSERTYAHTHTPKWAPAGSAGRWSCGWNSLHSGLAAALRSWSSCQSEPSHATSCAR